MWRLMIVSKQKKETLIHPRFRKQNGQTRGGFTMKVLVINGSPRANQCTATALDEVMKTLQAEGVET
jgi:hypothetical protein